MKLHQLSFDFTCSHHTRKRAPKTRPARFLQQRYGVPERWAGTVAELALETLDTNAIQTTTLETTIIEPFSRERIREVADACGHDWSSRLDSVYQDAGHIHSITCAEDVDVHVQCDYANQVMLGVAMLRAKRINGRLHAVVLWDESDRENPKPGGTGHFVQLCQQAGVPIDIINSSSLSS